VDGFEFAIHLLFIVDTPRPRVGKIMLAVGRRATVTATGSPFAVK
jgi:hypothetical protein